eukprot:TRINITY_DN23083_c0_g1_i1.p1 TRINITY_DN23083_c0_g1~~TRINITY_DN23083_c0_g1_i1.p1  ORF type:complete len:123 (-),score=18.15 TRINITY_DN23083_c0_g1_i1:464-832(-)
MATAVSFPRALASTGSVPQLGPSPLGRLRGTTLRPMSSQISRRGRGASLVVRAAQLPTGVKPPAEEPKLPPPLFGFTENAEIWNSRSAMIGLFGILAVEFIAGQGILQMIGIEVGKGLDLPL